MTNEILLPLEGMPVSHQEFLRRIEQLKRDQRLVGVAAGGSYITGCLDEFSDLDLTVAVEPAAYAEVLQDRPSIAASLGRLLTCYTGEHLGEPRLLICLYDVPLMIVDMNFVSLDDLSARTENPGVLWERSMRLSQALAGSDGHFPAPNHAWIERRFWVWVYFTALKIARGELFEAIHLLGFLRSKVLGPLALERANCRPIGLRHIETGAPDVAEKLKATLAGHDPLECASALRATAEIYRTLRSATFCQPARRSAEDAAMEYVEALEGRLRRMPPDAHDQL